MLETLNRYLVSMSEVVARHRGTIDKFMGDSIMVLFGAPTPGTDDVRRALACAVEMQGTMVRLNERHRKLGLPELYMGIGLNTGTVMAGVLGSHLHSEYTVIGDEVNLASRIEHFSLRGQILMSEATFDRAEGFASAGEPMDVWVKGSPHRVRVREVLAIPSLAIEVPRQDVRNSPRVAVNMPASYQLMENKIVLPAVRRATIVDIGYGGVLAELEEEPAPYADVKLDLDLSLIGKRASDVYAKVMRTIGREQRRLSGIEFTWLSAESEAHIKEFVQLLIQGSEER